MEVAQSGLGKAPGKKTFALKQTETFLEEKNAAAREGLFHLEVCALFQCNFALCNTEVLHVPLTAADEPSWLQESIQVPPAPSPDGGWCGKTLSGQGSWQGERAGYLKRGGGEKGCAGTL